MEAGALSPNLEDLAKYLSCMATVKDVNLVEICLNGKSAVGAADQLSDTFAIGTGHTERRKKDTPGYSSPSSNINTSNSEGDNSPGNSSPTSQHNKMNNAAATSFSSVGSFSSNMARSGAHTNILGSNPTFASKNHDSEVEDLQIPERLNPQQNGLCWYPCLLEQRER